MPGARPRRLRLGRVLTALVCAVAGLLVTSSAISARGTDLRPGRNTDLIGLVRSESGRNGDLARRATELRADVDRLATQEAAGPDLDPLLDRLSGATGLQAVNGPAVTVTLDDAPAGPAPAGVDEDLLVVHQQDIQSVANALWTGGAEAMTIQGQRVISTTGVKCVGNTVVLHGIPYAPPYVISAIGEPERLRAALAASPAVAVYRQYVDAYGLVYAEAVERRAVFPAYEGALDLQHAEVAR